MRHCEEAPGARGNRFLRIGPGVFIDQAEIAASSAYGGLLLRNNFPGLQSDNLITHLLGTFSERSE